MKGGVTREIQQFWTFTREVVNLEGLNHERSDTALLQLSPTGRGVSREKDQI